VKEAERRAANGGGAGNIGNLKGKNVVDARQMKGLDGTEKIEVIFSAQSNKSIAEKEGKKKKLHGIPEWLDDPGEHQHDDDEARDGDLEEENVQSKVEQKTRDKKVVESAMRYYKEHPVMVGPEEPDMMDIDTVDAILEPHITLMVQGAPKSLADLTDLDVAKMNDEEYRGYWAQAAAKPL